jgi:hypothetical protein
MKLLRSSLLVITACMCIAVILVPFALAAEQGTGTMQRPGGFGQGDGGQRNTNQMQAPSQGGQSSGNGGQMSAPPSGGAGNMTAPDGMSGPGMMGNNTMMHRGPPGNMTFDNTTAPDNGPGGWMGNGNMTHPEFMNQTTDIRGGPGIMGNNTLMHGGPMHGGPGNQTYDTTTATDNGLGNGQGGQNPAPPSSDQSLGSSQQQSKDDLIASLISQLQVLLSGKK